VGIATDFCVRATALDAAKAGFSVRVLLDLTVGGSGPTVEKALKDFTEAGVAYTGTAAVGQ
jgi:nicotinamidase/pyrazinamidase